MNPGLMKAFVFMGLLSLWVGILFVLSHMSGKTLDDLGFDLWDKAAHFCAYVPVGFLTAGYLVSRAGRPRGRLTRMLVLFAVAVVLATFDEIHQYFVPGRMSSVLDVVADVLGACLGGGFGIWLLSRKKG